ncbi:MAG TPA: hypothetical protein VEA69_23570 [Tepidisphaeraceae bacterium]|nr:hypothetical protein [Tepidisphaeraceae bacterium]
MDQPLELTIREVTRECPEYTIHQVKYAIAEYDIQPRRRVGIIRLWGRDQLPTIRSTLARIAGRREVFHHAR